MMTFWSGLKFGKHSLPNRFGKPLQKVQHDFERYSILALTSIYVVNILADNVEEY